MLRSARKVTKTGARDWILRDMKIAPRHLVVGKSMANYATCWAVTAGDQTYQLSYRDYQKFETIPEKVEIKGTTTPRTFSNRVLTSFRETELLHFILTRRISNSGVRIKSTRSSRNVFKCEPPFSLNSTYRPSAATFDHRSFYKRWKEHLKRPRRAFFYLFFRLDRSPQINGNPTPAWCPTNALVHNSDKIFWSKITGSVASNEPEGESEI